MEGRKETMEGMGFGVLLGTKGWDGLFSMRDWAVRWILRVPEYSTQAVHDILGD